MYKLISGTTVQVYKNYNNITLRHLTATPTNLTITSNGNSFIPIGWASLKYRVSNSNGTTTTVTLTGDQIICNPGSPSYIPGTPLLQDDGLYSCPTTNKCNLTSDCTDDLSPVANVYPDLRACYCDYTEVVYPDVDILQASQQYTLSLWQGQMNITSPVVDPRDVLGLIQCNIAIDRYVTATVTAARDAAANSNSQAVHADTGSPLVLAALKRTAVTGVDVELDSNFPVAAGLGGSSAASAALLGALADWRGVSIDRRAIAEEGRRIEVEELGINGGTQDHFAAAFGGALALSCGSRVELQRIDLSEFARRAFERRAILIYTGQSRISGANIDAVLNGWRAGDAGIVRSMRGMKSVALRMPSALAAGDLDRLGALVAEQWAFQRALHPAITTPLIDEIIARALASGALGAKALGASGGGCVLVLAGEGRADEIRAEIDALGTLLPFGVDTEGLSIIR